MDINNYVLHAVHGVLSCITNISEAKHSIAVCCLHVLVCACRVDNERIVTNRPLAGTRRRGATPEADKALEEDLLADQKECAEHVMLVDLGRNDVGKVSIVLASSSSGTFSHCSKYTSTTLCAESQFCRYSAVQQHWLRLSNFA